MESSWGLSDLLQPRVVCVTASQSANYQPTYLSLSLLLLQPGSWGGWCASWWRTCRVSPSAPLSTPSSLSPWIGELQKLIMKVTVLFTSFYLILVQAFCQSVCISLSPSSFCLFLFVFLPVCLSFCLFLSVCLLIKSGFILLSKTITCANQHTHISKYSPPKVLMYITPLILAPTKAPHSPLSPLWLSPSLPFLSRHNHLPISWDVGCWGEGTGGGS